MSLKDIESFLREKAAWIREKQGEQRKAPPVRAFRAIEGTVIHWRGKPHTLKVEANLFDSIEISGTSLVVRTPLPIEEALVRSKIERWLFDQAKSVLTMRFEEILARFPTPPIPARNLRIRRLRSRWGSCSPNGDISLHSGLIHYPDDAMDYVLAHEIAHLTHRNHKKRFYALLDRAMPQWRKGRSHLRGDYEPALEP